MSPRVAALYHLTDRVTAWGAVNSGLPTPPRCTTPVAGSRTCIESQSTSTASARLLTNRFDSLMSPTTYFGSREFAVGRLTLHRDGYGFLISERPIEGIQGDIFLPPEEAQNANHG